MRPASGPPTSLILTSQTSAGGGSSTLKKRPPPPPPGHKRTLSDPPSPVLQGKGSGLTPPLGNKTSTASKFEGIQQQQSSTSSNTKSTLGPRVLPKLPQKVALRKIDTIHLPSVDKPPPSPQKSPPFIDTSPKPPLTPVDSAHRASLAEKPHLSNLPPKPLLKDLPPKPPLGDRPGPSPVAMDTQGSKMAESQRPSPRKDADEAAETPVPLPRKMTSVRNKTRRVKTIYDCQADNEDELTFAEGEVIVVTGEEDQEWWLGHIEGRPERRGVFPVSFVHTLSD
ncbi:arf-GAP with SH3 domain, ANK repeat and PH domain-containing protein 1-like [Cottoperca gobio]|uniref:Arf-GAP with SH3 domain, ANK repeat and PH domain-containing protein 1-like n=1 Tax=Cottoperca gobio TaxID=56716 RepID=A0A6J2PEJ5_COTGO|nr:arf-GAP with SH3 domain, ANK repeat and PH domain-containing protein 1-like [Cottoperca gobio]